MKNPSYKSIILPPSFFAKQMSRSFNKRLWWLWCAWLAFFPLLSVV
jgi:hypothetical protein